MLTEPLPIEIFINARIETQRIAKLMNAWKVETRTIELILISHFREMGIHSVQPHLEPIMIERMITLLQNSPEIYSIVKKAEAAEIARKQSRHAEN